ncbi:unnamed protein product [marine sediment metagenome]|uniref:Acetyltransferase n=1 Tax=marine sediment metagenome TaxID=412755 RepID=X1M538_9ZZZZ
MDEKGEEMQEKDQLKIKPNTELQTILTDPKRSAFAKYQELCIGSSNLWFLLKYEVIISLLGPLPGALGLALRGKFFRTLLGRVGSNVVFGRNIVLRYPKKIHLGNNVIIEDNCVLDAKGKNNKGMFIGDNVTIGRNCVLSCKNGDLNIGNNTIININAFIQSAKRVDIGKDVGIGAYCYIMGAGDHIMTRTDIPIMAQGQIVKGIIIEDNAVIGTGAKIKDGITIGRDAFIGAGAVVTKSIPEFSIAVGVPARVIEKRKWNIL